MQFQKGQSGNPAVAARHSNKQTIRGEKLFAEDAEALARVAIDLARRVTSGRSACASIASARPIDIDPCLRHASARRGGGRGGGDGHPHGGIADGDLSAPEAAGLAKVIQGFTQALTTFDLDKAHPRTGTEHEK